MIETTEMVWAKHAATDQRAQVPAAAIPTLMQSGWEKMSAKEVAEIDKAAADELLAAEEAMRAKAAEGAVVLGEPPESAPDQEKSAGKTGKSTAKGND